MCKLGQNFWQNFLQPRDKIRHPKLGQNFCQKFCNLEPKWNIPNWGNFWKIMMAASLKVAYHFSIPSGIIFPGGVFLPSGALTRHRIGNFTNIVGHSNILRWNYTPENICDQGILLQDKSVRKSLPIYRFTRITFCLGEFPSGTISFMVTHCQELLRQPSPKNKDNLNSPAESLFKIYKSFAFWSRYSPMVSIHSHFQKITQSSCFKNKITFSKLWFNSITFQNSRFLQITELKLVTPWPTPTD